MSLRLRERFRSGELDYGLIALVHLVAVGVYRWMGVGFDSKMMSAAMQFADQEWLRRDLLGTVWYLHSQPPGFNLLLGIAAKTGHPVGVMSLIHLLCGLALGPLTASIAAQLGVRRWVALALGVIVAVRPDLMLYEHWMFYSLPVVTAVTATVWCGLRAVGGGGRRWFAATGIGAATALSMHMLVNPAWVAMLGAVLAFGGVGWRRVAIVVAPALLLTMGMMVRNAVVIDQFTLSSWTGPNLSNVTTYRIPEAERQRLVDDGVLSQMAVERSWFIPFDRLDPSDSHFSRCPEPIGNEVVDNPDRPSSTNQNYNFRCYLPFYADDLANVKWTILNRPSAWLNGQVHAWALYFNPPEVNASMLPNLEETESLRKVVRVVELQPGASISPFSPGWGERNWRSTQITEVILFALATIGLGLSARRFPARSSGRTGRLLVVGTIAVLAVSANALELGENNRFRLMVIPLVMAGAAAAVSDVLARRRELVDVAAGDQHCRRDSEPTDTD